MHQARANHRKGTGAEPNNRHMGAVRLLQIIDHMLAALQGFLQQSTDHHYIVKFHWIAIGFPGLNLDPRAGRDRLEIGPHYGPVAVYLLALIAFIRGQTQGINKGGKGQ